MLFFWQNIAPPFKSVAFLLSMKEILTRIISVTTKKITSQAKNSDGSVKIEPLSKNSSNLDKKKNKKERLNSFLNNLL